MEVLIFKYSFRKVRSFFKGVGFTHFSQVSLTVKVKKSRIIFENLMKMEKNMEGENFQMRLGLSKQLKKFTCLTWNQKRILTKALMKKREV